MKRAITLLSIMLYTSFCNLVQAQWTNGTSGGTIYREGGVGIGPGSSNPVATLDVFGTSSAQEVIWARGRIRCLSADGGVFLSGEGTGSGIGLVGTNGGNIGFYTGGRFWNAFQIRKTDGYVGIGTTNPTSLLSLGDAVADTKLALWDNGTTDKYGIGIRGGEFRLHVGSANAKFTFLNGIAGTELMTIKGDGSVTIGTPAAASPANYLLTVKGKITASEVKVSVAALGDYIFSPAYRLRPLSEVEAYVKENGHLPEVPSAAEVAREGMNVGEMENTLLKKIEELTLYMIDQNKKLEALQHENQQQALQIERLRTKEKNKR